VAKERLKSPRVRLFVALDLPDEIREGIVDWQRAELEPLPVLRPIAADNLHITLVFLGYKRERDAETIARLLEDLRAPAPRLRLEPDPVPVPRGRPRLFALATSGEGADAVQAEVEERLVDAGFYQPEKRPFWSHVTVARVRPEKRGSRRPARVTIPPRRLPEALLRPFEAVRVRLYRSILRSQGAQYTPVAEVELPRGGEEVI
jgi:2'-5' RNA ligase